MNSEKYIGLEVHQATISVAVMDSPGDGKEAASRHPGCVHLRNAGNP